jgi:exodeoxyribonuclease-5
MQFDEHQSAAIAAFKEWFVAKDRNQVFTIFGYAGTGKTTIARELADSINGTVLYAAFTGKAAMIMRKNGCHGARTIHSLIYKPVVNSDDGSVEFHLNEESALRDAALLIVDECSMVDQDLGRDLLSFEVPILVLGDPGQLPPIEGAGFFNTPKPDVLLTQIHRQAKDNPIIYLATLAREGKKLPYGEYGSSQVIKTPKKSSLLTHDQVIVGRHITRESMNDRYRKLRGFEEELPMKGERLICIKNNKTKNILNGEMFDVLDRQPIKSNSFTRYKVKSQDTDNAALFTKVHNSFFMGSKPPHWKILAGTDEFQFGYAITCHKAQGSQWGSVLVFDESWCFRDSASKWLYTAITRAQESLTIVRS